MEAYLAETKFCYAEIAAKFNLKKAAINYFGWLLVGLEHGWPQVCDFSFDCLHFFFFQVPFPLLHHSQLSYAALNMNKVLTRRISELTWYAIIEELNSIHGILVTYKLNECEPL